MQIRIFAIGADNRYYRNLQEEYDLMYSKVHSVQFTVLDFDKDKNHVTLFDEIKDKSPHILYLDFSAKFEEAMKLLNLILAYQNDGELTILGLHPQIDMSKTRAQQMKLVMETGLLVNHVKNGIDYSGPIFNAMTMRFPNHATMPKFSEVMAREGISTKLLDRARTSYLAFDDVQIETNIKLEPDTTIEIQTAIPEDVIPSNMYEIRKSTNQGLFSRRRYMLNCTPLYEDPIILTDASSKMAKAHAQDKIDSREHDIEEKHKPAYQEWLTENQEKSSPKHVKLAIVDRNLTLLKEHFDKPKESHISFRCWEQAATSEEKILNYTPSIIVFNLETAPPPESEPEPDPKAKPPTETQILEKNEHQVMYNDEAVLKSLVTNIAEAGSTPYIIIFGDAMSSDVRRADLGYTNLISYPNQMSVDLIIKLATAYATSKKEQLEKATEGKYIPTKETPEGQSTLMLDVKIMHLSEYTIDFKSEIDIPHYTSFDFEEPVKVSLFMVPKGDRHRAAQDKKTYTGLIHSLEENEIKNLRQYLIKNKK